MPRVRPPQARRGRVCPSAQLGSRELVGREVQSWLRQASVLATHTRSPEPASRGALNQLFPKTHESRYGTGCWDLTWHGFQPPPAISAHRHAPLFIHLRPSERGEGAGQWWETLG